MRKHARSRVRTRGRRVLLPETRMVALFRYAQDAPQWQDWRFETVKQARAQQMEADGDAERIVRMQDSELKVVGWRRTRPSMKRRLSPATLTLATMQAVAGERTGGGAWAEVVKFMVWPLIGDDRAVCVRPRMSDEQRMQAMRLLAGR